MTDITLADRVTSIPWYHTMELPGGVITPGINATSRALRRLKLPASFEGLRVLDIGSWDGFYAFEAHRRGAERVVATDSFVWEGKTWSGTGRRGFDLARESLGLCDCVEDVTVDVMDLSPERVGGTFDVVLFLGVLYHLRDPFGAIERVSGVCDDLLVLETELALESVRFPAARVYPDDELQGDSSNWFAFNSTALVSMLHTAGFTAVDVKYRTPFWKTAARAGLHTMGVKRFRGVDPRSRRVVIHARKRR